MSEQLIAARAALADVITVAQAQIDRARAALAALDGDPVPMVRPAPTPDVIDAPVTLPKPPQREQRPAAAKVRRQSKYDLAEVGEIARDAIEAGKPMSNAVAERLGVKIAMASYLIVEARKNGQDIPSRGERRGVQNVECSDCGKEFSPVGIDSHRKYAHSAIVNHEVEVECERATTQEIFKCATCSAVFREKPKLANHTITSHGRGPTSAENTPLAERVAA